MKRLIVSADDFGLTESVNQAVEIAHRDGLLAAASLMVAAPAAADAMARAKALPGLKVGLHLVLVEGKPALPPQQIPLLVDGNGNFPGNQARLGFRYFFIPGIRAQLAAEIRAQYDLFAATTLPLDHVNAHKHMHLHPTVARLAISIGREYGLRALRVARAAQPAGLGGWAMAQWCGVLRVQARRAGLVTNDYVAGLSQSGQFDEASFLAAIATLPDGVSEAYFHPATTHDPEFAATMPGYDHPGELAALLSGKARAAIAQRNIQLINYSDLTLSLTGEGGAQPAGNGRVRVLVILAPSPQPSPVREREQSL